MICHLASLRNRQLAFGFIRRFFRVHHQTTNVARDGHLDISDSDGTMCHRFPLWAVTQVCTFYPLAMDSSLTNRSPGVFGCNRPLVLAGHSWARWWAPDSLLARSLNPTRRRHWQGPGTHRSPSSAGVPDASPPFVACPRRCSELPERRDSRPGVRARRAGEARSHRHRRSPRILPLGASHSAPVAPRRRRGLPR